MQLAIYQGSFVTLLQNHLFETEVEDRKILIRQLCESLLIVYQEKFCFTSPLGQFTVILKS